MIGMKDMWKLFPRLIEDKINGLLQQAVPNRMKAYQIYKTCQSERLWNDNFTQFNLCLSDFFSLPPAERSKGRFDRYLERPMHKTVYEMFQLDFRTAEIEVEQVHKISNWTHHLMRLNCQISACLIEIPVLNQTLHYITQPPLFEKAQNIEFHDFCGAWKKIIFRLFGKRYDSEMNRVLNELHFLNTEQLRIDKAERFAPLIQLTQTEIDWTLAVFKAAENLAPMPAYPLMRGPQKPALIHLEKVVQLYNIVMASSRSEVQGHRDKVRATLLFRCQELMGQRAA